MKTIALIGCGAIADSFHLPALSQFEGGGLEVVLVDPDVARAEALAKKHGLGRCSPNHVDVLPEVDAAVITSPAGTHVPIARDCVDAGVPVLCEKPLGTHRAEVEELVAHLERVGGLVAVNQTRRFIPACEKIRELVASGQLGDDLSVVVREGDRFDWPAATPSMFGARSGGRGVLLDIGVHVLDLMTWWFGPDLRVVEYADDSFGGSEAAVECILEGADCRIRIHLSWLQKQKNEYVLSGTKGRITWGVYDLDELRFGGPDGSAEKNVRMPGAPRSFAGLAHLVLADFVRAVRSGARPRVSADDVVASMRLIEDCYDRRRRFEMPWHTFSMESVHG